MPIVPFQIPPIARLDKESVNESLRKIQVRLDQLEQEIQNRVRIPEWYVDGECSRKGRMVVVQGQTYTVVALRDTCDPPYIYPVGSPFWVSGLPEGTAAGFNYVSDSVTYKSRGQEYRLVDGRHYRISKLRWLSPSNDLTQSYTINHEVFDEFDQDWDVTQIVANFKAGGQGSWLEFGYTAIWEAGRTHRMICNVISESTPTSFSGFWDQKNANGTPGEGEMTFQNSQTQMWFHKTDENGQDQTAGLEAVAVGGTIQRGSDIWTVEDVDIRGSHVRYDVTPTGQRGSEGKYTFTFQWGAAAPLLHAEYPGAFTSVPAVDGVSQNENDLEIITDDQYMVDIYAQQITLSPDWQIISLS